MRKNTVIIIFFFFCMIFLISLALGLFQIVKKPEIENMGKASWYSEKDRGIKKRTANGEVFDDSQMTAAMWNVPLGKKIKITNQENGKSVVVRINDRGPAKKYYQQGRIIDLCKKAFSQIASTKHGIIEVDLDFIN